MEFRFRAIDRPPRAADTAPSQPVNINFPGFNIGPTENHAIQWPIHFQIIDAESARRMMAHAVQAMASEREMAIRRVVALEQNITMCNNLMNMYTVPCSLVTSPVIQAPEAEATVTSTLGSNREKLIILERAPGTQTGNERTKRKTDDVETIVNEGSQSKKLKSRAVEPVFVETVSEAEATVTSTLVSNKDKLIIPDRVDPIQVNLQVEDNQTGVGPVSVEIGKTAPPSVGELGSGKLVETGDMALLTTSITTASAINEADLEIETLKIDLSAEQARLKEKEGDLAAMEIDLAAEQGEVTRLRLEVDLRGQEIKKLKEELTSQQEEVEQLRERNVELKAEVAEKKKEIGMMDRGCRVTLKRLLEQYTEALHAGYVEKNKEMGTRLDEYLVNRAEREEIERKSDQAQGTLEVLTELKEKQGVPIPDDAFADQKKKVEKYEEELEHFALDEVNSNNLFLEPPDGVDMPNFDMFDFRVTRLDIEDAGSEIEFY